MENASKALIIAGSVLVAILLIAIGMKLFNSTSGTTESVKTTMNTAEIATFNNKFTQYVGVNKSRAQAISLINLIISNNSINQHKVDCNINKSEILTDSKEMMSSASEFSPDAKLTIQITEYENGYVKQIDIY